MYIRNYKRLVLLFLACFFLFIPIFNSAAQQDGVILLEPSLFDNIPGVVVLDDAGVPRVSGLGQYLNGIFLLLIGVASALAVITIAYGGIQYMLSVSVGKKEMGREKITAAFWGIILALASVVLLNTINPDLLRFRITESIQSTVEKVDLLPPESVPVLGSWPPGGDVGRQVEAALRKAINDATLGAVKVKTNYCTYIGQPSCTTLYATSAGPKIVSGVVSIYFACVASTQSLCPFTVSGGTEYWLHKTHGPDKAVVDIRPNEVVDLYLLEAFEGVERAEDLGCPAVGFNKSPHSGGFDVQWEPAGCHGVKDSHWHIVF